MTKNVVEFPKDKIVRENITTSEHLEAIREKGLQNFSDSVVNDLTEQMLESLNNYGIDTDSDTFIRDFSLTVDSLRSALYRTFSLKHTLHDFIDNNIKVINRETGEELLKIEVDKED